jgi:G3E family GTPase
MIPFFIVTGWLGSGKTSLLKNLLTEHGSEQRIAVIQNEFAPSGIDGIDLKNSIEEFKLVEINNGSVFCVCQLNNFTGLLEKLSTDYKPDVIFLESSGLADPVSVAQILNAYGIKDKVILRNIITVIDAVNFPKTFKIMPRFKHQVMVADNLVVNKTDLAGENYREEVINVLKKWNPYAGIVETSYGKLDFEALMSKAAPLTDKKEFMKMKAGNKPDIGLTVMRVHDKPSQTGLREFIEEILPSSQRIKGFVNTSDGKTMAVQATYGMYEITEIGKYDGRSELIIFNDEYSPGELHKMFKSKAAVDA